MADWPPPVKILQYEPEFGALLALYRERQPKRVLEIGTAAGGSLFYWLTQGHPDALVVSCDIARSPNAALFSSWQRGRDLVEIIGDSTSDETKSMLRDLGPFEWAFVDGDHSYEAARSDFALCAELVQDGVIALHDIFEEEIGVFALWRELERALPATMVIGDRDQGWGGIGVVLRP